MLQDSLFIYKQIKEKIGIHEFHEKMSSFELTLAVTVGLLLTPSSSLKMMSTSALNLNTDALLWPLMAIKVVVK